jgi:hypothetical protein
VMISRSLRGLRTVLSRGLGLRLRGCCVPWWELLFDEALGWFSK